MAWTTDGCDVDTGKQTASSILFARAGATTVRQIETDEVMEVRGLTVAAGKGKVPNADGVADNTTQTTYYAFIDGLVFSITVMTGSKVEWSAARKDESGQWVATKHTKTYAATGLDTNVWGTTPLDSDGTEIVLSASGVTRTVARDKTASFVHSAEGDALCATVTTTIKECRYINTFTAASAIVSANTATSTMGSATHRGVFTVSIPVMSGTEKFASARYVSPQNGWTVTITEKAFGHSGTNWS